MKPYSIIGLVVTLIAININCSAQNGSNALNKDSIRKVMEKVADWQIANFTYSKTGSAARLHDDGIDSWTNATFYLGLAEYAEIANKKKTYTNWLKDIGDTSRWQIATNFVKSPKYGLYHADELCVGQMYLKMYDREKKGKMLKPTRSRLDWIIENPLNEDMDHRNKQSWTWCDALFMAPPVYAHLAQITDNDKYLLFMDQQFKKTYKHLYDPSEKLFLRDDSYVDKREANGQKIFWGRGNGWVVAGLVNILKVLPENSEYRPFYEDLFKDLVGKLATLQDQSGFWHASLLDPDSYATPETSATALITYALAYGLNHSLLDKDTYMPITEKAWHALSSAVDDKGKLGWVQPIGADPKKVNKEMTAVYGVGAFLLAGTEMYELLQYN